MVESLTYLSSPLPGVEHLKVLFNLLICPSNKSKNGRAPKGDGGLNSRACLRIQFTSFFFDLFEGQISN